MRSGDVYDVFVSYARGDGAGAAELNGWLRSQSVRTFFDRSDLRRGLPWYPALEDATSRCGAVAVLLGEHGIGNTQQYELRRAERQGRPQSRRCPLQEGKHWLCCRQGSTPHVFDVEFTPDPSEVVGCHWISRIVMAG
jgi:hypothetical protein